MERNKQKDNELWTIENKMIHSRNWETAVTLWMQSIVIRCYACTSNLFKSIYCKYIYVVNSYSIESGGTSETLIHHVFPFVWKNKPKKYVFAY